MSYHIQSDRHWRISKSGYSIKTGWSDDSRIVAAFHAPVPFDSARFERWLEDAQHACDLHNASVDGAAQSNARIAELEAELSRLQSERNGLLTIAHFARRVFTSPDAHSNDDQLIALMNSAVEDAKRLRRIRDAAELVLRWDWSDNDDDCLDDMRELGKALDAARVDTRKLTNGS